MTLPNPLPQPDASWVVDERSLTLFTEQLQGPPAERAWHALRREAERIALAPGFDRLITLEANAIKELPHQIDVAQRVLRDMGGRAILADEVGLGKTIEASLIYKELAIRGLARRVLILTPASLVGQWQGELEEKFFERFDTPTDPDDWRGVTKAIVSHDRARARRHAEEILRHRWDLVIVDEALGRRGRPRPAAAATATPRGQADARRGGPVPAHHRVPAPAVSGRLHSAGRGGRGGRRGAAPAADQEGDPAARRDSPAPAAVLLRAGARRVARAPRRKRARQPRVPSHRAAARQTGGRHQDARQAGRADRRLEGNAGPRGRLQRPPPHDSADRRTGQEAGPPARGVLGRSLHHRAGQAHPRLPRGRNERPHRHPRRQRGTQPAVLQRAGELRSPLEPDGGGAAHRTAAPHRAEARGAHREP